MTLAALNIRSPSGNIRHHIPLLLPQATLITTPSAPPRPIHYQALPKSPLDVGFLTNQNRKLRNYGNIGLKHSIIKII